MIKFTRKFRFQNFRLTGTDATTTPDFLGGHPDRSVGIT